jgi:hypothetical protein
MNNLEIIFNSKNKLGIKIGCLLEPKNQILHAIIKDKITKLKLCHTLENEEQIIIFFVVYYNIACLKNKHIY